MGEDGERVLIVSLGRNGGCVRYATEIVEAWSGPPFDLLISSTATERPPKVASIAMATYRSGLEFVWATLARFPALFLRVASALLRGRYRSLYLPYFHHWDLPLILLFRLARKQVVFTVHDAAPHHGDENPITWWLAKLSIRQSTDLVFLTQHVELAARRRFRTAARTHVIPHGVFHLPGLAPVRQPSSRPVILFLGRILPYKGVEQLAEAVRGMDRSEYDRLIIAGRVGYPLSLDKFDGLEIHDRWLDEAEIVKLLNEAHVLAIPYQEATQSGVVTHGIDAGLPMVCTRVGGLTEQVSENEVVFVDPDPASIRAGLRRLTRDRSLYQSIRARLLEKRASLSWDGVAREIGAVLGRRLEAAPAAEPEVRIEEKQGSPGRRPVDLEPAKAEPRSSASK